jgi:hypothetical protein
MNLIQELKNRFPRLVFAFNNYRLPIVLAILFIVWIMIDWLLHWQFSDTFKTFWNTELDQIVSLATLMTALFVWYGEANEDWKNSLPKRLTVRFEKENGELVLLCVQAHLSDVADIRALGQQIGRQMCGNTDVPFRVPLVKQEPVEILEDIDLGSFLHYRVSFILTSTPKLLQPDESLHLPAGKYREWTKPFTDVEVKDQP